MTVDLHLHSTASDGALGPSELVAHAAAAGVTRLALTDHDTIDGVAEARDAACAHGIDFLAGIEISASWNKRTLHIVGLDIDPASGALGDAIKRLSCERTRRAEAIGQRLARLGMDDATEQARRLAGDGQLTRSHFARVLVESGHARDMNHAFKRYLGVGKPAFVRAEWIALAEAISGIHAAGGLAVLAHPFGYGFSHAWRQRAVGAFKSAGGNALEVVTGVTDPQQEAQAAREAQRFGLAGSAGSDFHSPEQFWLAPGRLRRLPAPARPIAYLS